MIVSPRKVVINYLEGNRGFYKSPGQMAFYAAFVIGLQFAFFGMTLLGLQVGFTNNLLPPQLMLLVVLIPFYTVISKLTFWNNGRSIMEHGISMIYIFSTWLVIFVILENLLEWITQEDFKLSVFGSFLGILFLWNSRIQLSEASRKKLLGYTLLQLLITAAFVGLLIFVIVYWFPERITRTPTTN